VRGLLSAVASEENAGGGFDPARPYEVDPRVAIRPEPFGALAYHYGNRRLTFLRDPALVTVLHDLGAHPSVEEAIDAAGVDAARRPAFRRALRSLSEAEVIRAR
jgi:putative mycofactocin binding protein MftB